MKVRVTNIQRFSLHDGPGIRTTVFLKGCGLKCPWCSNPENINYEIEKYYNNESKEEGRFGFDIELSELEKEILKDEKYYKLNNGGVTFSGGESLLQFDKLEPLLNSLNKKNINICIESSLFVSQKKLGIAVKYVDEFIIDIKILDKEVCNKILKGNINTYYENIEYLFKNVEKKKIKFRIPVTKEFTLSKSNLEYLVEFLKKYRPNDIEIFKIHQLGKKKYEALGKKINNYEEVTDEEIKKIIDLIEKLEIPVRECKI